MMLDHTRVSFSHEHYPYDPTDLTKTNVALFLTRWITHLCAPAFFFLAGTGAFLRRQRGATAGEMTSFLVSRGIWLVVLELTLVRIGITFNLDYHAFTVGQTIWALGWSMIVLGLLVHPPLWFTGAFGVVMIAVHNAFDGFRVPPWPPGMPDLSLGEKLALVLHQQGSFSVGGANGTVFYTFYPLVPLDRRDGGRLRLRPALHDGRTGATALAVPGRRRVGRAARSAARVERPRRCLQVVRSVE